MQKKSIQLALLVLFCFFSHNTTIAQAAITFTPDSPPPVYVHDGFMDSTDFNVFVEGVTDSFVYFGDPDGLLTTYTYELTGDESITIGRGGFWGNGSPDENLFDWSNPGIWNLYICSSDTIPCSGTLQAYYPFELIGEDTPTTTPTSTPMEITPNAIVYLGQATLFMLAIILVLMITKK